MLYNTIILRDIELSKRIRSNKKPIKKDIISFLDNLIYISKNIDNTKQLRKILVLFRKWYNLLVHFYGYDYEKSINSFIEVHLNTNDYSFSPTSILSTISKKNYKKDVSEIVNKLVRSVNPYSQFDINELFFIDNDLYNKYNAINYLEKANNEFKKSNFLESLKYFKKVISIYKRSNELDDAMLYFYSWAIHGLGNIEFIKQNFRIAYNLFLSSVKLKEQIYNLPKLFLYSSQSKMIISSIVTNSPLDWNKKLKKMYFVIEQDKYSLDINVFWYMNLLLDLSYNISKSYYYINEKTKALNYCEKSIKIGDDCGDQVGVLRSLVLKGILLSSNKRSFVLDEILTLLKNFDSKNFQNPYTKSIISEPSYKELLIIDHKYAEDLYILFKEFNISPFNTEKTSNKSLHLTEKRGA